MQDDALVLEYAIGAIEADNGQLERLDEFTERVRSGEFHRPTDVQIICDCVDGRCGAVPPFRPNSAGGSETIMVADDLTSKRFAANTDGSTHAQYQAALTFLHDADQPIGGHTAEGVVAPGSGCGANDKLPAIYEFIAKNGVVMRDMAARLGVQVDDTTQQLILDNAVARSEFSNGSDLLGALDHQPGAQTAHLQGGHREVLTVINTRPGTTLDREAMREAFPDHQAFNVDVWALENTARLLSDDETQVDQLVAAMVYYNLATAYVLGGKTMGVVVVK